MRKLLTFALLLILAPLVYGQGSNFPAGGNGVPITTVSKLASIPNLQKGSLAVVTDGASGTDCTTGSGTTVVTCQYSGTTWSQLGTGGGMTWPAGGAGIPNYNGSSAWGTSYSASNQIPANFVNLAAYALLAGPTFTGTVTIPSGSVLGTPTSVNLANATFPTLNQSTTGNAATATALASITGYSVYGSGTSAGQWITPTANGQCFMSGASSFATTIPSFQTCPSGFSNPMTTLGDTIYGGSAGAATRLAGPTGVNSVPQTLTSIPVAGAAVAPTWSPQGVPTRASTCTSNADTILATDRANYVSESDASACAVTLPQAGTTGFTSNFVYMTCAIGAGTVTITPTTSTISYSTGSAYTSAAASIALTTGQCASIYSDNTNYFAIKFAGGSGSGTVTSIATTSPITGGTITTTGTIACATCATTTNGGALSGTSPVTVSAAGAIGCATCVTSAASLTSTAFMTGGGSQASQTPSATSTLDSSGNATFPGTGKFGSSPPTCTAGTSGSICQTEGTPATGTTSTDNLDANSTAHAYAVNNNNTGEMPISRSPCVNVTPVTVAANVTTDQLLMACSLNANTLNVIGHVLKVYAAGVFSTAAASTASLTFKAKLCTVSGCGSGTVISPISTTTGATTALTAANLSWSQTSYIATQTAGASSAYEAHGFMTIDLSATAATPDSVYQDTNTATVGTIDSTGALFLQITCAASAASTSNSFTERELVVELVN